MKAQILLDTCILLDALFNKESLSKKALEWMEDPHHSLAISSASLWEVGIKHKKHPDLMPLSSDSLFSLLKTVDIEIISINGRIASTIENIANEGIHQDPFDQVIIATAAINGCTLLTKDEKIAQYRSANIVLV